MRRLLLTLLLFCPIALGAQAPHARNVILFLADAAGIPTINAASTLGYGAPRKLFIQRMPHIGLSETSTASELVTDSAAGMTAIVTGERTHNGVISQSAAAKRNKADGTALKTIFEYAEERGLSTGVISNDSLAGATPAALYAHANDRDKTAEIFLQAFTPRFGDGVDVMIGAGRSEIVEALQEGGKDLASVSRAYGRPILDALPAAGSFADRMIVLVEDQEFDLAAAVALATRALSRNPRGYFLMVESDAHTDKIKHGINRVVTFDRVIERVASSAGPDTLLLFTADHSYGLRVHGGTASTLLSGFSEVFDEQQYVRLPSLSMDDTHTGEEVLVAAQGPGADQVRGYMANTDLFRVMMSALGWSER